jgi:hypothetical protein
LIRAGRHTGVAKDKSIKRVGVAVIAKVQRGLHRFTRLLCLIHVGEEILLEVPFIGVAIDRRRAEDG